MAHVGDLIVTGTARCLNDIHAPGITTLKYSGAQTSGGYVGGTLKSNSTSEDDAITIEAGTNMTLKAYSLNNTLVLSAVDTTYSSKAAASGGTDVSLVTTGEKYTWNNKTSNTGTVTSITLKATSPISIDSSSAITTSGTRTLSHANSGVTAGTYQSVTVNATGHVTAGSALTKAQVTTALGYTPPTSDTNTHRPIQVNGTQILGNNTTALNLKAGSNVSVTNSSGTVTIAATNTNNAVTQTATDSTAANYELLFSATADNTTRTEGARKSSKLYFNPYYNNMTIDGGNTGKISLNGPNGQISLTGSDTALLSINTSVDETERLTLSHFDIKCYGTTWDGTHTSLKDALGDKANNSRIIAQPWVDVTSTAAGFVDVPLPSGVGVTSSGLTHAPAITPYYRAATYAYNVTCYGVANGKLRVYMYNGINNTALPANTAVALSILWYK